jgi:hypothetical protein
MDQSCSREAKDLDGRSQPDESGGSPGSAADLRADLPADLPADLLSQWRAAEERLYPMVMVIPEGYERVVRLVGETTVELQLACPDVASLVAEAPRVPDRVRRLATDNGVGDGFDFDLMAAAACLLRFRLLDAELRRQQRIRRIAAAAESGARWVTLAEWTPPTTWPPMPSATVQMHVASGRALEATVTMDEATGAPQFGLAEVQLDPATGEPAPVATRAGGEARGGAGGDAGGEERSQQDFADLQEWRAAIDSRRRQIELER